MSRGPKSIRRVGICFLVALVCAGTVPAQPAADDAPSDQNANSGQSAIERLQTLQTMYEDTDQRIQGLIQQYKTADATQRRELYDTYRELTEQNRNRLPALQQAVIAALREQDPVDDQVVTLAIRLMAHANRSADYAGALEIGTLLVEKKAEHPLLDGEMGAALFCDGQFDQADSHLSRAGDAASQTDTAKICLKERARRAAENKADDLPRVKISTSKGDIVLELFENQAPNTVANFISLAESGFYDGLSFHRVIPDFMAQGGDPQGDGSGGPGYNIPCECYREDYRPHFPGSLAMAHAGRDTGGSQFYITYRRTGSLDGRHTVFGRVLEGQDVLEQLQPAGREVGALAGEPDKMTKVEVLRKRDHPYEPTKVAESQP